MPTDQSDQSPPKPPGRMRLLWQALGRNRAGRLLRLAIIAIIGWAAVESVSYVIKVMITESKSGVQSAILWSTEYSTGIRIQTEDNVSALAHEPVYPLPPRCLEAARNKKFATGNSLIDFCLGAYGFEPFSGSCTGESLWAAACRRYVFNIDLFYDPPSLERLISGITEPCRYLPSPDRIARSPKTADSNVESLLRSWRIAGCDGKSQIPEYRFELVFLSFGKASADASEGIRKIILMVPTRG